MNGFNCLQPMAEANIGRWSHGLRSLLTTSFGVSPSVSVAAFPLVLRVRGIGPGRA